MDDRVNAVRFISLEVRGVVMSGPKFPARAARWICIWGLLAEISGATGMLEVRGPVIREVILAGHAEHQTCSSATSAIIEAAKQLDDSVEYMLTCGAAYFRAKPGLDGYAGRPRRPSLELERTARRLNAPGAPGAN